MSAYNIVKAILFVSLLIFFLIDWILNSLAGAGAAKSIFNASVGDISNKYNTPFTPSSWTFFIWNVIYPFQCALIIQMIAYLFMRTHKDGPRIFTVHRQHSVTFCVVYFVNFILNLAWVFTWDRSFNNPQLLILACVLLFAVSGTLYAALIIAYFDHRHLFIKGNGTELCWSVLVGNVVLQHNGVSLYATWTSIAQFLNLSICLTYNTGLDKNTASFICLSILLTLVVIYVIVDIVLLDRYTRYVIAPHCVLVWAFSGALVKNSTKLPVANYLVFLVALAIVCLFIKIIVIIVRSIKNPWVPGQLGDGEKV